MLEESIVLLFTPVHHLGRAIAQNFLHAVTIFISESTWRLFRFDFHIGAASKRTEDTFLWSYISFGVIYPLVMGCVCYCNSLLYGLPRNDNNKLQRPQNMAARLIRNTPRYCQITPVLYQLHWLPISVRIKFKVILIRFKATHGLVPYHRQNLTKVKEKSSHNLGSNDELFLAPPTFKSKKT